MAVGKGKHRLLVTLPIDLFARVREEAEKENRSISNYIVTVLQEAVKGK